MDGSNLPVEIIERILFFCDGQTLKTAKQVNPVFEKAVDYLFQVCIIVYVIFNKCLKQGKCPKVIGTQKFL